MTGGGVRPDRGYRSGRPQQVTPSAEPSPKTCTRERAYCGLVSALAERPEVPSAATDDPRPSRSPHLWSSSERRWDRVRYTLILGWLLAIIATPLTGERASSWGEITALVAAGEVDAVRVVGELPRRGTGYSVVEVHWRHGLLRYTAEVVHVQGRGNGAPAQAATDTTTPRINEAPSSRLTELQPGLEVTREDHRSGAAGELLGWHVPPVVAMSAALLFFAGFGLLIAGPQPWRATRWAWFWLLLPPVGSVAFLLLSGPTPGLPSPRNPRRRLTGGVAFLMSLLLMPLMGSARW